MKAIYTIHGFNITTNPDFQNEHFGNAPELVRQMETLYFEAQDKNNKRIIDKLNDLIIKYPKSPQVKNYLMVAYNVKGNFDKADEVNRLTLAEHPDYLFARINQAFEYIGNEEFHKVPEVLGIDMDLKLLYPERNLFHLAEVTAFFRAVIYYYTAIENLEMAENRLTILEEIAPEHPDTESATKFVMALKMKLGMKRWEEEEKQRIKPEPAKVVAETDLNMPAQFNHPEMSYLYNSGLRIERVRLKEIISLPRETLIADLEKILLDAIDRYGYFKQITLDEDTEAFPLHALFLLTEIKAEESLQQIISFLEYNYDFLNFWLGDHKTENLWRVFYQLGKNRTDLLKQLLLKPGIDTYIKTSVTEAFCQMVIYLPEKRTEILHIFEDVFKQFSHSKLSDNLIDSDFLGLAIGDAIDCDLTELRPIIKILYDKAYVGIGINGGYQEVEKEFKINRIQNKKRTLFGIFDLYDHILSTWAGYNDEEKDDEMEDFYSSPVYTQPASSTKIGRNDPCPCGSGKKYKKCCAD